MRPAATGRPVPTGEIHIDHTRFGAGYGKPTPECLEALRAVARLEGVILDPVYTGKAMAGLIGWIREGRFTSQHSLLFWQTGGSPGAVRRALYGVADGRYLGGHLLLGDDSAKGEHDHEQHELLHPDLLRGVR